MGRNETACQNCCYWQKNEGSAGEVTGICRLLPPVALESGTVWPVTRDIDWCGEFDQAGANPENEF